MCWPCRVRKSTLHSSLLHPLALTFFPHISRDAPWALVVVGGVGLWGCGGMHAIAVPLRGSAPASHSQLFD